MQQGDRIQPIAEILEDPSLVVDDALELLGLRRPTAWMQRLRRGTRGGPQLRTASGVRTWDGRVCCAEHLNRFMGRGDLALPFDTTCPDCQRVYRIRLDIVSAR